MSSVSGPRYPPSATICVSDGDMSGGDGDVATGGPMGMRGDVGMPEDSPLPDDMLGASTTVMG